MHIRICIKRDMYLASASMDASESCTHFRSDGELSAPCLASPILTRVTRYVYIYIHIYV